MGERGVWSGLSRRGVLFPAMAMLVCTQWLMAQSVPAPVSAVADGSVKLREYEVVSIKENKSSDGMVRMMSTPDGFSAVNMNLNNLIANAYGVRYDLISGGPGWTGSKGFDVAAKVAGPDVEAYKTLDEKDRLVMMQALLRGRFGLQAHIETKELQVYDLAVAKGGVKLKAAAPDPPQGDTPPNSNSDLKTGQPVRRNGTSI